jgi:chemotaxis protein MotB
MSDRLPTYVRHGLPPPDEEQSARAWMMGFTDLVILLLVFFTLLYAMRVPELPSWLAPFTGIHRTDEPDPTGVEQPDPAAANLPALAEIAGLDMAYLQRILTQNLAASDATDRVRLSERDGQLVMSLPADTLFAPGDITITHTGTALLFALAGTLSRLDNRIEIVGYTGRQPSETSAPGGAWGLGLLRAAAVARALVAAGYQGQLNGYGGGDGTGLARDLPLAEREAFARRVDLLIDPARAVLP